MLFRSLFRGLLYAGNLFRGLIFASAPVTGEIVPAKYLAMFPEANYGSETGTDGFASLPGPRVFLSEE